MEHTIENDVLIGEFVGFDINHKIGGVKFGFKDDYSEVLLPHYPSKTIGTNLCVDELQFHKSFDWIMIAVEKVREVGAEVSISYAHGSRPTVCYMYMQTTKSTFSNSWGVYKNAGGNRTKTMIEAVYNSVVEFIKWYNENK